jgi:hypothetical protein
MISTAKGGIIINVLYITTHNSWFNDQFEI